jgi:hypothetical protein
MFFSLIVGKYARVGYLFNKVIYLFVNVHITSQTAIMSSIAKNLYMTGAGFA